jgi:hypothetical protein
MLATNINGSNPLQRFRAAAADLQDSSQKTVDTLDSAQSLSSDAYSDVANLSSLAGTAAGDDEKTDNSAVGGPLGNSAGSLSDKVQPLPDEVDQGRAGISATQSKLADLVGELNTYTDSLAAGTFKDSMHRIAFDLQLSQMPQHSADFDFNLYVPSLSGLRSDLSDISSDADAISRDYTRTTQDADGNDVVEGDDVSSDGSAAVQAAGRVGDHLSAAASGLGYAKDGQSQVTDAAKQAVSGLDDLLGSDPAPAPAPAPNPWSPTNQIGVFRQELPNGGAEVAALNGVTLIGVGANNLLQTPTGEQIVWSDPAHAIGTSSQGTFDVRTFTDSAGALSGYGYTRPDGSTVSLNTHDLSVVYQTADGGLAQNMDADGSQHITAGAQQVFLDAQGTPHQLAGQCNLSQYGLSYQGTDGAPVSIRFPVPLRFAPE